MHPGCLTVLLVVCILLDLALLTGSPENKLVVSQLQEGYHAHLWPLNRELLQMLALAEFLLEIYATSLLS